MSTLKFPAAFPTLREEAVSLRELGEEDIPAWFARASDAEAAELFEETAQLVEVADLLFVVENFFRDGQESHHEVGLYFRATLPATSPLKDTARGHDGVEGTLKLEYRWFMRHELGQVNLRPAFLRDALAEPMLAFRHSVQRGENAP